MGQYGFLMGLGVVAIVALYLGYKLRPKKGKNKSSGGKNGGFYQDDSYKEAGGGDGGGVHKDANLYAMREGKGGMSRYMDDDYNPNKKKKKDEYESWEDY